MNNKSSIERDRGVSIFSSLSIHEILKNSKLPNFFGLGDRSFQACG